MKIKGKEYKLYYTNRSLINIEEQTGGTPFLSLLKDKEKMSSMRTISVLIWAGINNPEITVDDVIDNLNPKEYEAIFKEVETAFINSFNTGEKKKNWLKR